MEDKKEIVDLLETLLKATRAGNNVLALRLNEKQNKVKILFWSGGEREVNIDGDSGDAIIRDVMAML